MKFITKPLSHLFLQPEKSMFVTLLHKSLILKVFSSSEIVFFFIKMPQSLCKYFTLTVKRHVRKLTEILILLYCLSESEITDYNLTIYSFTHRETPKTKSNLFSIDSTRHVNSTSSDRKKGIRRKASTNALTFTRSKNTRSWNRGLVSNQLLCGLIDLQR